MKRSWLGVALALAVGSFILTGGALTGGEGAHGGRVQTLDTRPYGWPLAPVDVQHPIRGFFGDPRTPTSDPDTHGFHWGIDVACRPWEQVYATISGYVVLRASHPESVVVQAYGSSYFHEYWHVRPVVRHGQVVQAGRTVIARVVPGDVSSHVHFAEHRGGRYLNPLRKGALHPFRDSTRPVVRSLTVRAGDVIHVLPRSGHVDLVADAYDSTPLPVPGRFGDKPVTPAVVAWRLGGGAGWRVAWDVRETIPARADFHLTYGPATRQNTPYGRDGRYRFYLAHGIEVSALRAAGCIDVRALDTRGNASTRRFTFRVFPPAV